LAKSTVNEFFLIIIYLGANNSLFSFIGQWMFSFIGQWMYKLFSDLYKFDGLFLCPHPNLMAFFFAPPKFDGLFLCPT
jgi:hypothetical protein